MVLTIKLCTHAKLNFYNRTDIKMDWALNNLQRLICHKTQTTNEPSSVFLKHAFYLSFYTRIRLGLHIRCHIKTLERFHQACLRRIIKAISYNRCYCSPASQYFRLLIHQKQLQDDRYIQKRFGSNDGKSINLEESNLRKILSV